MHGYITRATQHWRRRSKSESQSLKILVAGGTYLSGAGDPQRGWHRLRWRWLAMIMRGVEGTFLRLTMVDRIITSYKADDGYDELSRYWDDDRRPGSHQDPEKILCRRGRRLGWSTRRSSSWWCKVRPWRQQFETLSQIYRDLSTFNMHCKHFLTLVIFVHCVVKQSTLYFLMVVDPTDIQQKYFYMAWKVKFCETED